MKLSIITPCFNGAEFIETAILSILRQDTEEVELIIINDGSFDETESICQSYVSSASSCPGYPIVRYYRTENKGAGHARNFGIEKVASEWIAFLDADDLYLDHALNEHFCQAFLYNVVVEQLVAYWRYALGRSADGI